MNQDNGSETETVRSTAATGCFYFFGELRSDVLCPLVSLVVTHTVMFTHVSRIMLSRRRSAHGPST